MKTPYEHAKGELGVTEIAGEIDNKTIVEYFAEVGHSWVKDDETAWCAAFIGAMIERSGYRSTRELNARSYLKWGIPVAVEDAVEGDIVIFKRGDSAWQGHVTFLVKKNSGGTLKCLGGNQRDQVNVQNYSRNKLLGIRRVPIFKEEPQQKVKRENIFARIARVRREARERRAKIKRARR